ncbi:MAG: hypothetical protein AAF346_03130, partial [Pseudomonadota bacterium]
ICYNILNRAIFIGNQCSGSLLERGRGHGDRVHSCRLERNSWLEKACVGSMFRPRIWAVSKRLILNA